MTGVPMRFDVVTPAFTVTVAARLAGMHPQTLRQYDKLGLVVPARTGGRGRRYSLANVRRLRMIQHLSQVEGINLQGIQRILTMEDQMAELRKELDEARRIVADLRWMRPDQAPRVFTADSSGRVNLGARVGQTVKNLRALPPSR